MISRLKVETDAWEMVTDLHGHKQVRAEVESSDGRFASEQLEQKGSAGESGTPSGQEALTTRVD